MRNARYLVALVWNLFFLTTLPTHASYTENCNNNFLVVDESIRFSNHQRPQDIKILLPTKNTGGVFQTNAALHIQFSDLHPSLDSFFDFENFGLMSLPYSVYQVEFFFAQENAPNPFHYLHDFTENCTAPGPSIYPGQHIVLPSINLPTAESPSPPAQEILHVRVWGHL